MCLGPLTFDPGPEFVRRSSAGSYPELWERELRCVGEEKIYRLPDVLVGRVTGRDNDHQITCFRSEGTGVQFAAVASTVYQKAKRRAYAANFLSIGFFRM